MIAFRCDFCTGDTIDNEYRVEKLLGEGSFGNVYKVTDGQGRVLALKLLRLWEVSTSLHENLVERFRMEYRVSQMSSDYFVHSYQYGEVNGNPYFTMEYCSYGDLSHQENPQHRLPQIAHDILCGLNDLHSAGLVHRDLKPENVMIKKGGIAALTDFGIVGDKKMRLSLNKWGRPRQVFGTYLYMAPEQADRKGGGVTYLPTTDIFSFGVMMYEILTEGKFPFGVINAVKDLDKYQHNARNGIWNRMALRSTSRGGEWETVIERCLAPDYKARFQSAEEVMRNIPHAGQNLFTKKTKEGDVKRLIVTLGAEIGREYHLFQLLSNHKRMLRIGRETDNEIEIKEGQTSYSSRYHCTMELDKDNRTWYIRDGQWRMDMRQWVESTNGTFLNNTILSTNRTPLQVGDIITIGDLKLLVETY